MHKADAEAVQNFLQDNALEDFLLELSEKTQLKDVKKVRKHLEDCAIYFIPIHARSFLEKKKL